MPLPCRWSDTGLRGCWGPCASERGQVLSPPLPREGKGVTDASHPPPQVLSQGPFLDRSAHGEPASLDTAPMGRGNPPSGGCVSKNRLSAGHEGGKAKRPWLSPTRFCRGLTARAGLPGPPGGSSAQHPPQRTFPTELGREGRRPEWGREPPRGNTSGASRASQGWPEVLPGSRPGNRM